VHYPSIAAFGAAVIASAPSSALLFDPTVGRFQVVDGFGYSLVTVTAGGLLANPIALQADWTRKRAVNP